MISIVIPVFNEEKSLEELYKRTAESFGKLSLEIIFVNDGSLDGSRQIIEKIIEKDNRVTIINFRKNKGKSAALMAGFKNSKGETVVTMDGDLQDQPEEAVKLIKKLDEGYDLVSGWKKKRNDPGIFVSFSHIFNWIIRKTTGLIIHDINSGFKVYKKEVVKNLSLYGDLYRFIPILAAKEGFLVGEIEIEHAPRMYGKSKYGFSKFYNGFFDLLTVLFLLNFKSKPFHLFGTVGLFLFSLGSIILVYLTTIWFLGQSIGKRPLLIFGILLVIVGIQIFSLGLIAELLVNIRETQKVNG